MSDTRIEDQQLRALYDRMLDERLAVERAACVTPERMLAVVRRAGSEEDRLATLDHVMACGACAREFELVRAIEDVGMQNVAAERGTTKDVVDKPAGVAGSTPEPAPVASPAAAPNVAALPRRASWARYAPLALAASLLLAVGVGVVWRSRTQDGRDVVRGASSVTLLAPPTEARGSDVSFAWRPVPGAVRYELEVVDSAGGVAFARTTSDTTIVPDARRLAVGAEYRWWVRAVDAAGTQRASEMRRLRVRRD